MKGIVLKRVFAALLTFLLTVVPVVSKFGYFTEGIFWVVTVDEGGKLPDPGPSLKRTGKAPGLLLKELVRKNLKKIR